MEQPKKENPGIVAQSIEEISQGQLVAVDGSINKYELEDAIKRFIHPVDEHYARYDFEVLKTIGVEYHDYLVKIMIEAGEISNIGTHLNLFSQLSDATALALVRDWGVSDVLLNLKSFSLKYVTHEMLVQIILQKKHPNFAEEVAMALIGLSGLSITTAKILIVEGYAKYVAESFASFSLEPHEVLELKKMLLAEGYEKEVNDYFGPEYD